ncbi:MAG: 30S ribosomal protein S7 [Candidatus Gottesmanbacteria bacterium GW2011_GWA2_41_12]|uniref:Small ribosomal subunit protein uS7 n=2 Tax=Candidatus Gottesmaniibacteriota TaxID=1752720 RepID=A0A0G0UI76_9BACT|nr:MAG: 30S ribosomal protein S7 [Candidatus Gottesmanbacteria bacterium GW2011_GWC2_39_8]KKR88523.1 MAG: 30S ribosomal protein S7 [Candidatus Gottesmanbacteria bacterium GW2011_GWA2_41_12]
MSRSGKIKKRITNTDAVYGNKLLAKFINRVMRSGKKSVAQGQVYGALELIKAKNLDPLTIFQQAVQNVGPRMEVKARRVGGASYQVPMEVRGERRISLAIRWIIQASNNKSNKEFHSFAEKLSQELMDAANNAGEAIKKRDGMQRNADANKAFSHFRW